MIFVDTNVFMYAVGRAHPLRDPARGFFADAEREHWALCTSAEVVQELLHAYLPVQRMATFEAARELMSRMGVQIWPLEEEDVVAASSLRSQFAALNARDLCHLASCRRRHVSRIKTYDQALASAFV